MAVPRLPLYQDTTSAKILSCDGGENAFHILLADAHTCSRIGLYQVLTDASFSVVAETTHLDDLERLLQEHQPPVLLLAGNLLLETPVPFLVKLCRRYPETRIVLFLADCNSLPLHELAATSVTGMVLKTEPTTALVQAIQASTAGNDNPAFSPAVMTRLLQPPDDTITQAVTLSTQEHQLLQLLCAEKNNAEIAQILNISHKTVEKQLTALYAKLDVKTRVGAAVWYTHRGA